MAEIEDLLRKREKLLQEIDAEISESYTRPVTLLFTDIVGSTTYFEEMGDIAGRQMIQTHNDLLFPIVESKGGRIIKTIGDSIMASFEDPNGGVDAAVEMQKALQAYNRDKAVPKRILVRMGMHFGQAVVDGRDLFGDMVNTAARVEAKARGEEILLSGELEARVESQPLIHLGSEVVKGRSAGVDFYLVNWLGLDEKEIIRGWEGRKRKAGEDPAETPHTVDLTAVLDLESELRAVKPLPVRGNPYLNRVMIPHPEMFYGREAVVRRIMGRIDAEKPQSVSIVGERRIGKSSLLNHLRCPGVRCRYLEEPGRVFFVFIDFQQLRAIDSGRFVTVLFQEIRRQFEGNLSISLEEDFDGLRFLCDRMTALGLKLVFLFDEFESVTKNDQIGPEFYSFLRSLANNFAVAFITASGRNLKDMCVTHEISDSPFFNIFATIHLGLFKRAVAEKLITEPSESRGIALAPLKEPILTLGGLYPFFLQMACSSWFEYLEAEELKAEEFGRADVPRDVLEIFREEAEAHFEFVLENFPPEEKEVCRQVLSGATPIEGAADGLVRKGYLIAGESGLAPFSSEFGFFLTRQLL